MPRVSSLMRRLPAVVILGTLLAVYVTPAAPAEPAGASLPTPRAHTSSVFDGRYAYVIGGNGPAGMHDDIVRYDPLSREVFVLDARLPTPRTATSAVWDGTQAWIFGGKDATGALDEILRFDPATGVLEVAAHLPEPRAFTSAAWTGKEAVIFAGTAPTWDDGIRRIVRFDPASLGARHADARLPDLYSTWDVYPEWSGSAAFAQDGFAYVYVPWDCSAWCGSGRIYRYDPVLESVTLTPMAPPYGRPAAAHDGTHAYLVGGYHRGGQTPYAYGFDLASGRSYATTMRMTTYASWASAVWAGDRIVVFGGWQYGYGRGDTFLDAIVEMRPEAPGPVDFVRAVEGGRPGEVVVHWRPPAHDGGFVPLGYEVVRVTADGAQVVAAVAADVTGIVDTLEPGVTAAYHVLVTNPKGTSPVGGQGNATAPSTGQEAVVVMMDGPNVPADATVPYGGIVRFTSLAVFQRRVVQSLEDHAHCFDSRTIHAGWSMPPGSTFDLRLLYEPEEGRVHASDDGRTFHACFQHAATLTPEEAVVPYRSWYYNTAAQGQLHVLPPST